MDLNIYETQFSFSPRIRGCQIIQSEREGEGHQINLVSLCILQVPGSARISQEEAEVLLLSFAFYTKDFESQSKGSHWENKVKPNKTNCYCSTAGDIASDVHKPH